MYGRFAFYFDDFSDVRCFFHVDVATEIPQSHYNLAPGQAIPAIVSDGEKHRFGTLHWGLQPAAWYGQGPKPINTRVETLHTNIVLRHLAERKRMIIPASGYYEWDRQKQPYYFSLKDQPWFALAGIYDVWRAENGETIRTCSILTTKANAVVSDIHTRMPVILQQQHVPQYLSRQEIPLAKLKSMLKPFRESDMRHHKVSPKVGNFRYQMRRKTPCFSYGDIRRSP
ncbi:SOS response-associated peptidase [Alicyclobacillus tolerans]|uniref:SOS response-associated peptidase n=1 Tax=Alicyclobacillus tolerans TaxID=90970 RepID=UPI003B7D274B